MTLDVMSFNLRVPIDGHPAGHPDQWRDRLPATLDLLRQRRPHLIGTQEGEWRQLSQILDELPHYRLVGTGREGGSKAEYSAVLYDDERLRLERWDQWWLSQTPNRIGSRGWDASCTRVAVIAEFTDLATQQGLTIVNTHLDHMSDTARTKAAEQIAARLPEAAALVTGDFNCAAGQAAAWQVLTEKGLVDTWQVAERRDSDEISTFHGYTEPGAHLDGIQVPRGHHPDDAGPAVRIDWIMATPDWRVSSAEIVTDRPGGVWPSDHWPVAATVELR